MRIADGMSRVFSTVFHPLVIPTLGLFILFRLNTHISYALTPDVRRYILLLVFFHTALIPALSVIVLKRTGHIHDYSLRIRAERIFPLMVSAVTFFFSYYLLNQLRLPSLIDFYMMGATLLVLVSLIVSFSWRISLHMVALGGVTGFFIVTALLLQADFTMLIVAAFLVSGLTGASRLQSSDHHPAQIYAGYLAGLLLIILLFLYLRV